MIQQAIILPACCWLGADEVFQKVWWYWVGKVSQCDAKGSNCTAAHDSHQVSVTQFITDHSSIHFVKFYMDYNRCHARCLRNVLIQWSHLSIVHPLSCSFSNHFGYYWVLKPIIFDSLICRKDFHPLSKNLNAYMVFKTVESATKAQKR